MKKKRLWIGMLIVLFLWQILHFLVDPRLIPSPVSTLVTLGRLLFSGELLIHCIFSLYRLFIAVFFALVTGVLIGVSMGMNKRLEEVFAPLVYVLFPVPKAALLPVLFVLFGLGDSSKIILIWLILFFQVVLSVYDAVTSISEDIFMSSRTLRLSKRQVYIHVVLPAILPHVLSALRTSVGIGIAVLFFAETYATNKGLGYYIMNNWSLLNYEAMYSGIIVMGGMGYIIFSLIDKIRSKLVKWTG